MPEMIQFLGSDHCPLRLSMAKLEAEKEVLLPDGVAVEPGAS